MHIMVKKRHIWKKNAYVMGKKPFKVIMFSFRIGRPQVLLAHIVDRSDPGIRTVLNTLCEEEKGRERKMGGA